MRAYCLALLAGMLLLSTDRLSAAEAISTADGRSMIVNAAPKPLADAIVVAPPVSVTWNKKPLALEEKSPGLLENRTDDLLTQVVYEYDKAYQALWYQVRFTNKGDKPISGIVVAPLAVKLRVDPPQKSVPRIRYLTGSQHYDATYPSRAFQVVDRAFMTNDHHKSVKIAGGWSHEYVPMMQVALQQGPKMAGFMVGFEWSCNWSIEAGYETTTFGGGPIGDFVLNGNMELGDFSVRPGQTLRAPKTHLVFFEGNDWTVLDNAGKRYIRDRIAWKTPPKAQVNKVTYDHWFGIHSTFDIEDMMRQAKRAADLGCEYFCLDAGWYGEGTFGASGKGAWNQPDPAKFPNGVKDVQRLSKYCRDRGMGFGLWSFLVTKNASKNPPFDLSTPEGVQGALDTLREWIKLYDLTWFRFEMAGFGDLQYMNGFYELMETITKEHPDFHIECCYGGGTRFDLGMIRWCTSTWLSDHTGDPDVCRFNQTGALRFWPSYFLNLAVRVHRKSGDYEATVHNFMSRMVGAPSFNGDIAQWSDEATQRMRKMVDIFKSIRHLQSQPAFFPLNQVRNMEDWDVVCYGDGTGEAQLMYAFRTLGPEKVFVKVPEAKGDWKLVVASADQVKIEKADDGFWLTMPPRSAACWKRQP